MKLRILVLLSVLFIFSSCESLTKFFVGEQNNNPTPNMVASDFAKPKKIYTGAKIPAGPMNTETYLLKQAADNAAKYAKQRADRLRRQKRERLTQIKKSSNPAIDNAPAKVPVVSSIIDIETEQVKEAAKRMLKKRENARKEMLEREALAKAKIEAEKQRERDKLPKPFVQTPKEKREIIASTQPIKSKQKPLQPKNTTENSTTPRPTSKSAKERAYNRAGQIAGTINESGRRKKRKHFLVTSAGIMDSDGTSPQEKPKKRVLKYKTRTAYTNNPYIERKPAPVTASIMPSPPKKPAIERPDFLSRQYDNIDLAEEPMLITQNMARQLRKKANPTNLLAVAPNQQKSPARGVEEITSSFSPLKNYYFPIESLEKAKAYRYISMGDNPDTTYWLMKALNFNGQTFLITETYDSRFKLQLVTRELVDERGVFVMDYTSYEVDGLGEAKTIECGIDEDEGFRWNMSEGDKITLALNYNSSLYPNYDIVTQRDRYFVNQDDYVYKGKTLRTIVLEDKETTVYTDHTDSKEEYASIYKHHYAEGVGLVKYMVKKNTKAIKEAKVYQLQGILSYKEWQALNSRNK